MEVSEVLKALGHRIRVLREERGWTQEQLAEKVGVSRPFMGMAERGEKGVALETIVGLADAFGVTLAELFLGVHAHTSQKLGRLSSAVAGQPAEVQASIVSVVEELLKMAYRK